VSVEGERAAVDALVERIATLSRISEVDTGADAGALARYGLASPRAKVTMALKSGATETLALGDENPFDGTAFVRTTAGVVALVPGDLGWAVERSTFDLRETRLLPFDEGDVERVEVAAPTLTYALAREGSEGWRLDVPLEDRGDDATVRRVLGAIRGMRATSFAPAAPDGGHPLPAPRWRVALSLKGGRRRAVAVFPVAPGGTAPTSLRARVEGSSEVATLAADATRDLEQDLFALRDKTVLRFDRDRVTSLRFDRGGTRFEVRREAAPRKLAGYLGTLSSLRAKAFTEPTGAKTARYGLDRPALQVALVGADGKELERLLVSAPLEGRTFATATDKSERIVEIDPAALESLPRTEADAEEKPSSEVQAKAGPK
jgi:hypothetical protein